MGEWTTVIYQSSIEHRTGDHSDTIMQHCDYTVRYCDVQIVFGMRQWRIVIILHCVSSMMAQGTM